MGLYATIFIIYLERHVSQKSLKEKEKNQKNQSKARLYRFRKFNVYIIRIVYAMLLTRSLHATWQSLNSFA